MSLKKIRKHNPQEFLDDLKSVREVLVFASGTSSFFKTTKKELKKEAETQEIIYYLTDTIYAVKRTVMVIV